MRCCPFLILLFPSNLLTIIGGDARAGEKHVPTLPAVAGYFSRPRTRKYGGDPVVGIARLKLRFT
jgi:hypothetical protein